MKNQILILLTIIAVTLSLSTTSFAQLGDLINKAKDAAKKKDAAEKKDKKAEEKPATTNPTPKSENKGKKTFMEIEQEEILKVEPSSLGKIYFSNKPFAENRNGSQTSFNTGDYIYGRLEITNGTLRDILKFTPITKENPKHRLVFGISLHEIDKTVGHRNVSSNLGRDAYIELKEVDLDKTYLNFDVFPDPSKATTALKDGATPKLYDFFSK